MAAVRTFSSAFSMATIGDGPLELGIRNFVWR